MSDSTFHYQEGWGFRRTADGGVVIVHRGSAVLTFDAPGWASVVASMQAGGETAESFYAALSAQTGDSFDPATGGTASSE